MSSIPVSTLLRKSPQVRPILIEILGSPKRANMALLAMRLQAYYGKCYASAGFIAAETRACEKTWDRCLARMKATDLVKVRRRIRPNGTQGTNQVDLARLWQALLRILHSLWNGVRYRALRSMRVGRSLWLKAWAQWEPVEVVLLGQPPP